MDATYAKALGAFFSNEGAYCSAVLALAKAINQNPGDREDLRALARAAYVADRPTTAKWAIDTVMCGGDAEVDDPALQRGAILHQHSH
jgi:hypothetical protein